MYSVYLDLAGFGISAKSINEKLNEPKEIDIFQKYILEICRKLKEKCPLRTKFVKGESCFSPSIILVSDEAKLEYYLRWKKINDLTHSMINSRIAIERIEKDYIQFISKEYVIVINKVKKIQP